MFRIKPKGRYVYKCTRCGVYIKMKTRFCRSCICDILGGYPPGEWLKRKKDLQTLKTSARIPDFTFA